MRKGHVSVEVAALGLLVFATACGQAPSNDHTSGENRALRTQIAHTAPGPDDSADLRVGEFIVEDNVRRADFPPMQEYLDLIDRCFAEKNDSLCDKARDVGNRLQKRGICLGRWNDRLGDDNMREHTWHLCDDHSIWTTKD